RRPRLAGYGGRARVTVWPAARSRSAACSRDARTAGATRAPGDGWRADTAMRSGRRGGSAAADRSSPGWPDRTLRAAAASAAQRASGPNAVRPCKCWLAPPASGTRPGPGFTPTIPQPARRGHPRAPSARRYRRSAARCGTRAAARPVRNENGRVREITGATRVYLHLAHPSAHARTPQVMNAEFARRGVDAVAVSADVAPGDLGGFVRGLRGWRNLAGLSVTMPHKEALASHVDELAGPATLIGAVNVVRREPDGRLVAANTDGSGLVIGLLDAG